MNTLLSTLVALLATTPSLANHNHLEYHPPVSPTPVTLTEATTYKAPPITATIN